MSEAATNSAVPSAKGESASRNFVGWLFAGATVVITSLEAAARFIEFTSTGIVRTVADAIGGGIGAITFLFPLFLAEDMPSVMTSSLNDFFVEFLNGIIQGAIVAPFAFLVGLSLHKAARRYGWRYVIPGYVLGSLALAFFWAGVTSFGVL